MIQQNHPTQSQFYNKVWNVHSYASHVWLFEAPWTAAHQAPLSIGFPRQEYWSGLPFPSPGNLHDPGIKPTSHVSPTLAGEFFTNTSSANWEARWISCGISQAICWILLLWFSCSLLSDSATPWTTARQASQSFTVSQSFLKLINMSQWCHQIISSSVAPFSSCPPFFPVTESFPMNRLFTSSSQSIGVLPSASVLPMNTILKVKNRTILWVDNGDCMWVVNPCNPATDWESQLAITAQHHEWVTCCMWLAWKISQSKIQNRISIEHIFLLNHHEIKKAIS